MGIYKKRKEIEEIYYGKIPITEIYQGAKLVWEAIRSCFGKGFWVKDAPWNNTDGWRNNS